MVDLNIDASRTALLSMDMQTAIISIYTKDEPEFLPRGCESPQRSPEE